jgi:uncharacterized cupin superfamily protein
MPVAPCVGAWIEEERNKRKRRDVQTVTFGQGDLVKFSEGLSCNWTVHEKVRKHYRFG